LAAAAITMRVPVAEAEVRLQRHKGVLARVFEENERQQAVKNVAPDEGLVLCVDAGGTSCKAVVMSNGGSVGCGVGGPCNV
jgi:N-acetylmuramic acid 6-phosphate etherase